MLEENSLQDCSQDLIYESKRLGFSDFQLARLILKSPEVVFFDEATSALDNTNEVIIQKNIEKLFADKTIITIAHRLTTLKNSDRILVFDEGKIVQEGTFSNLSKKKGLFKNFLEQHHPSK